MKEDIIPVDPTEQGIDVTFFEQIAPKNTVVVATVRASEIPASGIVMRKYVRQQKIDRITGLPPHLFILRESLDQQEGFQVHAQIGRTVIFPVAIARHMIDPCIHQGPGLFDQHAILIKLSEHKHVPDPHDVDVGIGYPDRLTAHPGDRVSEDLVE